MSFSQYADRAKTATKTDPPTRISHSGCPTRCLPLSMDNHTSRGCEEVPSFSTAITLTARSGIWRNHGPTGCWETAGRRGATMILPGETEAGTAGTQPCRGISRWAHRDDEPGREDSRSCAAQPPSDRKTPCLENLRPKGGILTNGERCLSISG